MNSCVTKSFLGVFALLLIATPVAAADGFTVDVTASDTVINPSEDDSAQYSIDIVNTGAEERVFWITYNTGTASNPNWYGLDRSAIALAPNESGTATLRVQPARSAVAGNQGPEIVVYPLDDVDNRFSQFVTFTIRQENNLYITGFDGVDASYDPGEELSISIDVKNVVQHEIPANSYRVMLSMAGRNDTVSVPGLEPGETAQVQASLPLEGLNAGIYDMRVRVSEIGGSVHSEKQGKVEINAAPDSRQDTRVDSGFLSSTKTVSVTNTGNTVLQDIAVSAEDVWYNSPFISFEDRPDMIERRGGDEVFVWDVQSLSPGQTVSFTYEKSYWSIPVVIAILLVVGVVIVNQFRRVTVVKSVKRKDGRFAVHLRVKNNTGTEIEDVSVEDFVPGIAMLVRKFDSRKPDRIRNTDEGTEVVWEFGRMMPDEERIITYVIRPKIRVEGYVTLPSASASYRKDESSYTSASHSASADFRE